jgi:cysteinyl-tRNA synthetase
MLYNKVLFFWFDFLYYANSLEQIIDNGCAYVVSGDVYFSVDNFPEYGKLSGRKLDDNRAGERVAVDDRKKNPADFALWKVIHVSISII